MRRSWKQTLGSKCHTLIHCNLVFVLNHVWSQMYFFLSLDNFCKNRKIIIPSPIIAFSDVKTRISGLSNFIFPLLLYKSTRCFISFSRAQIWTLGFYVVCPKTHIFFPRVLKTTSKTSEHFFHRFPLFTDFCTTPKITIFDLGVIICNQADKL